MASNDDIHRQTNLNELVQIMLQQQAQLFQTQSTPVNENSIEKEQSGVDNQSSLAIENESQHQDGEVDKETFIEAIRNFGCLWDTKDPAYKQRNRKANAWKQLSEMFKTDCEFVKKFRSFYACIFLVVSKIYLSPK